MLNIGALAGLVTAYVVDEPSPPAGADAEPVDKAPRFTPTPTTQVAAVEAVTQTRPTEPPPTTAAPTTTTTAPPETTTTTTTVPPEPTDTTASTSPPTTVAVVDATSPPATG